MPDSVTKVQQQADHRVWCIRLKELCEAPDSLDAITLEADAREAFLLSSGEWLREKTAAIVAARLADAGEPE